MENWRQSVGDLFQQAQSTCVCACVCICVAQITFDFAVTASIRFDGASISRSHSVFLHRFLIFRSFGARPQCMWCCNWQGKSLHPPARTHTHADAVCAHLFYHFQTHENRRQTKQLDFPLRTFSSMQSFSFFLFFSSSLCFAPLTHSHWMCCCWFVLFGILWTVNDKRRTAFVSFIFCLYFVYVLLHHFNCFRTQATQHNDKKKLRLKIQDGDASEECTSEWSKRKTCEDFLFIQIVLSVFHASRQSLVG